MVQKREDQPSQPSSPPRKIRKKEPLKEYDPLHDMEQQIEAAIRGVIEPEIS